MPELTFDEFGNPVWTNAQGDRTGTDPEPLAAAIDAMNAIGAPGGIPIPPNPPQFQPGAELPHAPPAQTPENAIMSPDGSMVPVGQPQLTPVGSGVMHTQNTNLDAFGIPLGPEEIEMPPEYVGAGAPRPPTDVLASGAVGAPKKAKPGKVDDVTAANAALDLSILDAADANARAAMGQNEAARQLAERRAGSAEEFAGRQADADTKFQAARAQAQADSDRETAQWMGELESQAKKEPNPQRWFAQKSTFGKAMFLLSLAFGTKAAASAPGVQNVGLAMWKEEMDRDVGEQRARLAREMEVLRTKGQVMDRRTAQRMANIKDDHSIRAGQLLALEKAALERANAPGSADDQQAMLQAHSWLAQQRMSVAATRSQQAYQSKEAKLGRAHAAWMQANAQAFQAEQKGLDRIQEALMKNMEISGKVAAAGVTAQGNEMTFDPQYSGIAVTRKVNGKMVAEPLTVSKEQHAEMLQLSQPPQRAIADLLVIKKAMQDGSFVSRVAGADPELTAALNRSAYQTAKINDPKGIVTNADFANGMKTSIGFDMSTVAGRALAEAKMAASGRDIADSIDKEINRLEVATTQELNATVDASKLRGGTIAWRAVNRNVQESEPESLDEATARVTGKDTSSGPITSVGQLEEAQKAGKALPAYGKLTERKLGFSPGTSHAAVVKDARDNFAQVSPEKIDELYAGYNEAVGEDKRASVEIYQAAEKAKAAAEAKVEEAKTHLIQETASLREPLTEKLVKEELTRVGLARSAKDPKYVTEVMDAVRAITFPGAKKQ